MRIIELCYSKEKGKLHPDPGCLPAPPGDKLKSVWVRRHYPAFWSTTWDTVRLGSQMYLQLKLWAFSFCQATAASVHIHDIISFCLKQLHFHSCVRARAVQTGMLKTPLGDWGHPKRAVLSKLSTGKMLKELHTPTWEPRASEESSQMSCVSTDDFWNFWPVPFPSIWGRQEKVNMHNCFSKDKQSA